MRTKYVVWRDLNVWTVEHYTEYASLPESYTHHADFKTCMLLANVHHAPCPIFIVPASMSREEWSRRKLR